MAMLCALCAVVKKDALFCLHVEHGLRPAQESTADAEFVRSFCEKAGVSCAVESIAPGKIASFARRRGTGIEAAARFFRRRALFRKAAQLGENTRILTAHTKDDMLELSLMRVLRGAGPAGLCAMPVNRGKILRPLLGVNRAEIIEYLKAKKITWREDSTNKNENFLRNRVRRQLIPLLNESFPSWKSGLLAMAQTQSFTADFLAREARNRIVWEPREDLSQRRKVLKDAEKNKEGFLSTDEGNFFAQAQIVREEALFQGIDALLAGAKNPRPVKRSVLRRFCAGDSTAADLGPVRAGRRGGKVSLSRPGKVFSERGFSLLIKEPGLYNLKKTSIEVSPSAKSARPFNAGGFFAELPVVFRRSFKDDFLVCGGRKTARRNLDKNLICALDRLGCAAFIGHDGVLFARDAPGNEEDSLYFVTVKRG
jgi:tRNA(Ile)-lysidine synthase